MNLSDFVEVSSLLLDTVCVVIRALTVLAVGLQILALQRVEIQRVVKHFVFRVSVVTAISLCTRANQQVGRHRLV